MAKRRYDAVLFDFDGVLADTEPLHCACWAEAVRPLGIHLDWQLYEPIGIGASDRDLAEFMAARAPQPLTSDDVMALHPLKTKLFAQRVLQDPPIPHAIIELVKSLDSYKLAVVTSSFRHEIEPMLVRVGIRDCFGAFIGGDDVEELKPAPDPYLRAANLLQAKSPLVVEDSDAGEASARAAGFDCLRIAHCSELPARLSAALGLEDTGPGRA